MHLPLAHPGAEQVGRVAGVAQHVDVRAAVAEREQHALVDRGSPSCASTSALNDGERELDVEVVLERQVEEGVDAVLAALLGDVGDGAALERFSAGLVHLVHGDAAPVAAERRSAFFSSSRKWLRKAGSR